LEVSAQGFRNYVQPGIELRVGTNVQQNVEMQVGAMASAVEASGSAAMAETRDAAVSQMIDQRDIVDLPLNGPAVHTGASVTAQGASSLAGNFPSAVKLLRCLPLATTPCGLVTYGIPANSNDNQYIYSVDYTINAKNTFFARYFDEEYNLNPSFSPSNVLVITNPRNLERGQTITLEENYTINATTLNSPHFTFVRRRNDRGPVADGISPTTIGSNVYVPDPSFLEISVSGYLSTYCGTGASAYFNTNTWSYAGNFSMVRGRQFALKLYCWKFSC
jgi:hypothetical protein